jgi:hypothetical protein
MKSAEDRELIIIQAWDRANLSIKDGRQPEPLEPEMIKYVSKWAVFMLHLFANIVQLGSKPLAADS